MSFRFPTDLSNDDIQQCLSDMQINLDPSQLIKPTPEAVRTYYEQAVIALMDTSREELARPDFAALTGMEYMELHDESIPFLNFLQKLTKLMQFCGITDFTLNDIFKPEPARLRRHFCAMINFARYREEKVTNLDMLQNRLAEMMRLEHSEMERKEKNLAELKRLKERRAARQQEAAAVEMDTQAITAKIMQHNKVHTVLAEETRGIKAQTNALTDQAAELKLMLNSLYDKCSALQDELVHSPEKHKTVINDLCAAYDKKRDYHAGLSSLRAEHERKLDMLTKFEKDLQRCVTAVVRCLLG
ncbi:hypothetical protein VOLCADRAFT_119034 [Volvox carteri f. nagariensis]|uniref:Kinetochore protein Nuf2 N-terminal domain-containing protein n=1 Tax=Volvox carteri f. nagariensis TaxID=3068 RepID=D8U9M3_VOLCA|nr:uncharacterized protein VOLCADRAFT_119034 [Volvox carteri f. nagariensis]EFJ43667.1 hypothetical protein VOLCADRAFT_119034 [Volvox carteri f. nagariensis]|eukprot:XP_002955367.1 hypothetical protein VOLCADRAFT_119034 [Volvox carteri f. nagariensis]